MLEFGLTVPCKGNPIDGDVGVQLQSLRIFQGLSRDQAAEMLLIPGDILDQIESGNLRPLPPLLLKIATTYNVSPSRLFAVAKNARGPNLGGTS